MGADRDHQGSRGLPHRFDRLGHAIGLNVFLDPFGGAPQRQLAQCDQVSFAEKILSRPLGLLRQIDLAGLQPGQQFLGRQVDQDHLVGAVEETVRHRFGDRDPGDARDHVVQRFQMLDVQRGKDIDSGLQQLLDVLPAFGVARARCIGVCELIDQQQARRTGQCFVQVELMERHAAHFEAPARQHRQAGQQDLGFAAPMRFDHADRDIDTVLGQPSCSREHRKSLADTGRRTEIHAQPTAPRPCGRGFRGRLGLDRGEQRIRIGALIFGAGQGLIESNARFSSSTLTRGSPRNPRSGPSV